MLTYSVKVKKSFRKIVTSGRIFISKSNYLFPTRHQLCIYETEFLAMCSWRTVASKICTNIRLFCVICSIYLSVLVVLWLYLFHN